MPKLCLNMIVKNESRVILRLLNSVVKYIDCYCICDTGSTDNTVYLIETFFKENGIPGKIVNEPFRDFGYNRTFAIKQCDSMDADYILLLDADMVLWVKPEYDLRSELKDDGYLLFQGSPSCYYKNTRIVKNHRGVTYWGVTHEYVDFPKGSSQSLLLSENIHIDDIGDGGAKHDKFTRDIKLLEKGLKETPTSERYMFYLANSYLNVGNWDKSTEWYNKRILAGGWGEEIWYSYYNMGKNYEQKNDMANAIYYWMEGYNYCQDRIENIHRIINHYRRQGYNQLAYHFYAMADKQRNHGKRDFLFTELDIYDYKLDYELSIFGYYYNPDNCDLAKCSMKVLKYADDSISKNVLSNYKFYAPDVAKWGVPLSSISNSKITYTGFSSSTPSLVLHDNKLYVNTRHVNYKIVEGNYINQTTIDSKNVISVFKSNLSASNLSAWTLEREFELQYNTAIDNRYVGLEDVRLFSFNNQLYFNANRGLDGNMTIEHGRIKDATDSVLMYTANQHKTEKNWVLAESRGELKMIYGWSPLKVGNIIENQLVITHTIETPKFFKDLRGSTNGVIINDEIWFICHAVSYETRRYYYHIIVILDLDFNLKRYTKFFTFEKEKVEYTLGMVVIDDNLLIGYSTNDNCTKFLTLPISVADSLFI